MLRVTKATALKYVYSPRYEHHYNLLADTNQIHTTLLGMVNGSIPQTPQCICHVMPCTTLATAMCFHVHISVSEGSAVT